MKWAGVAVVALFVFARLALGQQVVDQGAPGKKGPWPVTITSTASDGGTISGTVATYPRTCTSSSVNKNTVVGGAATAVPAAANASRIYVTVCNSAQNASTAIVKCRSDNTAPVYAAGNPGDVLLFGDCVLYAADGTNSIQCIADSAGRNVTTYECVP